MFDGKEFGKEIVAATRAHIDKTVAPLLSEIAALKAEVATLKSKHVDPDDLDSRLKTFSALMKEERDTAKAQGREKRQAAVAELKAGILAECETIVAAKVAELPAPKDGIDGKSITVDDVAPMIKAEIEKAAAEVNQTIPEAVQAAVAALPAAKDGKDADPEAVAAVIAGNLRKEIDELRGAVEALPAPVQLPDIPAMITDAITGLPNEIGIKAMISEAIAAIPPAQDGKDADPELMALLAKEAAERAVAALPVPKDGQSVAIDDVRPLIDDAVTKAVTLIQVPKDGVDGKDGRDGVDVKDLLVVEGGDLVATFTDGRTKVLGPFRGKDADIAPLERTIAERLASIPVVKEFDQSVVAQFVAEEIARISKDGPSEDFAPDDVADNISSAIKMMAERPLPQIVEAEAKAQQPNSTINIALSDNREPQQPVSIHMPEAKAPIVEVAAPIVNVSIPEPHKRNTRTIVKKHDAAGRIIEFEQEEI